MYYHHIGEYFDLIETNRNAVKMLKFTMLLFCEERSMPMGKIKREKKE